MRGSTWGTEGRDTIGTPLVHLVEAPRIRAGLGFAEEDVENSRSECGDDEPSTWT